MKAAQVMGITDRQTDTQTDTCNYNTPDSLSCRCEYMCHNIFCRDHFFDTSERKKNRRQLKKGMISKPQEIARGTWLFIIVDESGTLPTKRLGIPL